MACGADSRADPSRTPSTTMRRHAGETSDRVNASLLAVFEEGDGIDATSPEDRDAGGYRPTDGAANGAEMDPG